MTDPHPKTGAFAAPCVPQHVESERLVIRPTTRADLPSLQRWWNNPAVSDPAGELDGMQYDERDMVDWYARHVAGRGEAHHFMICLRDATQQPIGEFYIACDDCSGAASFGLVIGEINLWNQGYGREAALAYARALFATACYNTIRIEARRSNTRALRWCQSIGFEVEQVWANGRSLTLSLTQSAFEALYGPVHAPEARSPR
ncbi:MAG: GNAT family N-acetyltransferase [Chloroflexota bacterium]|jgi:RimJ/RimL family protein N-acetyltransferase|nr:GNAT family N-acetyltransferase [Anaerolineae bacterium]HMM28113.1 GNAT family N-acetyltransferase [Aggregatilineaceae bacterium]